jgi:hypothetical protein
MSDGSFDSRRRLCPDGACIGVIGSDGRCGECGRTTDGKPRVIAGGEEPAAAAGNIDEGDAADADDARAATTSATAAAGGFDPNRRLCDDGSCVGVVGADGRCSVCGTQAA